MNDSNSLELRTAFQRVIRLSPRALLAPAPTPTFGANPVAR
jgi:hypothetical protein